MALFSMSPIIPRCHSTRQKARSKWAIIGISLVLLLISIQTVTSEGVEPVKEKDANQSTTNRTYDNASVCPATRYSLLSILLSDGRTDGSKAVHGNVSEACTARPKCDELSGCTTPLNCFNFTLLGGNTTAIPPLPSVVVVTPNKLEEIVEDTSIQNVCAVVLFYAPWCTFSVQFARKFNALGRSFEGLPFLAVDLAENEPYKYILAYLPLVAFYYRGKTLFKFSLDLSFDDLRDVIANITGFHPLDVSLTSSKNDGPVPTRRVNNDHVFLALAVWWVLFIGAVYGMKSRLLRQCCSICFRTRRGQRD